jgi:competence protein ComFC
MLNCEWQIDMVIPIPLSSQRYKERGYDQIALVANPLSMQLGLVYSSNALIRTKNAGSQVGPSALERKANVEDAFLVNTKLVTGESILLSFNCFEKIRCFEGFCPDLGESLTSPRS